MDSKLEEVLYLYTNDEFELVSLAYIRSKNKNNVLIFQLFVTSPPN